ncbi:glycosyl hydrolase family 18 protein [Paenibacillus profundus]|uniref:Glycosyl hydrolase family 18 protein n=1 Tax=Paenibacillus profundus TaxID=1173085 RepID=A0ABS8YNJ9_9BACL|nr:glycosyl hydrolase family 18 protein [Paenibacillus profundus]MCE5171900.1 glycosyl hydrolase family 18 protein [Paenibacillus profundus]
MGNRGRRPSAPHNRSEQPYGRTTRSTKKKRGCGGCLFILIGIGILAISIWKGLDGWWPNNEIAESDMSKVEQPLTWNGTWSGYGTKGRGEKLLIPLEALQKKLPIVYEAASDTVILTSAKDVASLQLEQSKGTWNGRMKNWDAAAVSIDGDVYVPVGVLQEMYGLQAKQYPSNGAVQLGFPGQSLQAGVIAEQKNADDMVTMRQEADKRSAIVQKLSGGSELTIWKERDEWVYVEADGGAFGYLPKKDVQYTDKNVVPDVKPAPKPRFVEEKKSVSLAWEAVYSRNPDPAKLPSMPGTNVISPTWFSLADDEGNVQSKGDLRLSNWARRNDKEVWALYSNSFEPERTTEALSTFERRSRTIEQLLRLAEQYQVDGINLDYENVNVEDRDQLTQFVRELTPRMHAQGLVVSIDVTAKSSSGRWSQFLDREKLGEVVDFMMVMAYDEHWAASPIAGSVASLPWVEQSVTRIMEEDKVPAHKLVLGMPLYTRIWTEEVKNGETKVSSKSVGMRTIQELLQEQKLKPVFSEQTGQNYVEFKEDGVVKKIWIEDERSVRSRIVLAQQLGLGGIAVWARSFADSDIWNVLLYPAS